jgi:N-acetylneuraminate synthase
MSFTEAQWSDISECCHDHGIEFICSPFSMEAFDKMEPLVDRWKIASSKVNDHELIDACVATEKPVIVSSGMSDWLELDNAAKRVPGSLLTVLHCVSAYPCLPEWIDMRQGNDMMYRYGDAKAGLSDHSGTIWPSIFAAVCELAMAEVHVVFSRECFGPDVSSSVTTAELKQLVEGVRFIKRMQLSRISKDEQAAELKEMREIFSV